MNRMKVLLAAMVLMSGVLVGCQKEEGTFEKMGREADKAADKTAEEADKAAKEIKKEME